MSFETYPIVTQGSNVDLIRQGHNILTTKVGDLSGLQTQNKISVVDALNSLQIAFNSLIFSAYPPLNNEQWLVANNFAGSGTINILKMSSSNELVFGTHILPFSTLTDIGKLGTGFRAIYGTTLHITTINAHSPSTRIGLNASAGFDFNTNATTLSLTEVSGTQIKLESIADQLDIISTRTRIQSGSHIFELTTAGHWMPNANNVSEIGATGTRIKKVWAVDADSSGTIAATNLTVSGTLTFPANDGGKVPVGAGMLWFGPDNQVPTNYLILRGDVVAQATYPALYALYGTTFNTGGEGGGNFRLPDMRNQIPFGANPAQTSNPNAQSPGLKFGSLNHTHSLPAHGHVCSTFNTTANDGNHTHGPTTFSGAVSAAGAGLDFQHRHDYNHAHSHYLGTSGGSAHSHGAGSLSADSAGSHTHPIAVEGNSGSGSNRRISENYSSPSGTTYNTNSAGAHTHNVSGSTGNESSHTHTITGGIYDVNTTYGAGAAKTGWMEDGSGNVALNAHRHSISSSGSHNHNIPQHNVGNIGSANGDGDLTSGGTNPPCFAVWFIVRAR